MQPQLNHLKYHHMLRLMLCKGQCEDRPDVRRFQSLAEVHLPFHPVRLTVLCRKDVTSFY